MHEKLSSPSKVMLKGLKKTKGQNANQDFISPRRINHKSRQSKGHTEESEAQTAMIYSQPSLYRHSIQRQFCYNDNLKVTKP